MPDAPAPAVLSRRSKAVMTSPPRLERRCPCRGVHGRIAKRARVRQELVADQADRPRCAEGCRSARGRDRLASSFWFATASRRSAAISTSTGALSLLVGGLWRIRLGRNGSAAERASRACGACGRHSLQARCRVLGGTAQGTVRWTRHHLSTSGSSRRRCHHRRSHSSG